MLEILKFTECLKNSFQGFLDIKIQTEYGIFVIKDISVFKKEDSSWISFPYQQYEKDGVKKYKQYNWFESPESMKKFQNELFKKLEKFRGQTKENKTIPISFNEELPF
jgi:hypothetical protein